MISKILACLVALKANVLSRFAAHSQDESIDQDIIDYLQNMIEEMKEK